jgi:hypothetical protein
MFKYIEPEWMNPPDHLVESRDRIEESIAVLRGYYGYGAVCDKLQECSRDIDELIRVRSTRGRVYQETKFGIENENCKR